MRRTARESAHAKVASLRTCEVCSRERFPREFPPTGQTCWTCKRKGWFPPDYLEAQSDAAPTPTRMGGPPWLYPPTTHQKRLMREAQGGRCAICRLPGRHLVVDHCHGSKFVRGLLCPICNSGLGFFRDDPALLREAADYIERPIVPARPSVTDPVTHEVEALLNAEDPLLARYVEKGVK